MNIRDLKLDFQCKRIEVQKDDYRNSDRRLLGSLVFQIFLTREFEKTLLKLSADGCIHGPVQDLRTVSPKDIDYQTIGDSLARTGLMLVVEQAPKSQSLGDRIAAYCQRCFFDSLDGPIETISGLDIPNPVSKVLESAAVPSVMSVRNKILNVAKQAV